MTSDRGSQTPVSPAAKVAQCSMAQVQTLRDTITTRPVGQAEEEDGADGRERRVHASWRRKKSARLVEEKEERTPRGEGEEAHPATQVDGPVSIGSHLCRQDRVI